MKTKTKKRKTKQQKAIDKTFVIIHDLLETAQKAIHEPAGDRYVIHHSLLELIPTVETVLNNNGFTQTELVLKRIKEVAELVVPSDNLGFYQ